MKILNLDEFLKLPPGTIFSNYTPRVCDGLLRKEDTIARDNQKPDDFIYSSLVADCWNGDFPDSNGDTARWGRFDCAAQFAVYEPDDVARLIDRLS